MKIFLISFTSCLIGGLITGMFFKAQRQDQAQQYRDLYHKYNDSAWELRWTVPGRYAQTLIATKSLCEAKRVYDSIYDKIHQMDAISHTFNIVYFKERFGRAVE